MILLNTVLLALESDGMSASYAAALEKTSTALTYLFVVEFALKLLALGAVKYFSSAFNTFDAVVVTISLFEAMASGGGSGVSALRSLRTFRVFRSLRVLRVFKAFRCAAFSLFDEQFPAALRS